MAKVTLASIVGRLEDEVIPLIKEHDKILVRGNGVPSLQEEVRNLKAYIQEDRENRKYYFRLFVSTTVINLAALIGAFIIWMLKIYPLLEKLDAVSVVAR